MVLALQFYKSLVQWLLKCNFVNHLCRGLLTNFKQTAEIRLIYFLKKLQPWLQMEEVEREEICSEIIRPDKLMGSTIPHLGEPLLHHSCCTSFGLMFFAWI